MNDATFCEIPRFSRYVEILGERSPLDREPRDHPATRVAAVSSHH